MMPQASQQTEDDFRKAFAEEPDDGIALAYLDSLGIKDKAGRFVITKEQCTVKVLAALWYLVEEWDYDFTTENEP